LDVAPQLAQLIERVRLGFRRYRFSPLRGDRLARPAAFLVRSQIARPTARIDVGQRRTGEGAGAGSDSALWPRRATVAFEFEIGSGTEIRTPNLAVNRSLRPFRNAGPNTLRAAECRLLAWFSARVAVRERASGCASASNLSGTRRSHIEEARGGGDLPRRPGCEPRGLTVPNSAIFRPEIAETIGFSSKVQAQRGRGVQI